MIPRKFVPSWNPLLRKSGRFLTNIWASRGGRHTTEEPIATCAVGRPPSQSKRDVRQPSQLIDSRHCPSGWAPPPSRAPSALACDLGDRKRGHTRVGRGPPEGHATAASVRSALRPFSRRSRRCGGRARCRSPCLAPPPVISYLISPHSKRPMRGASISAAASLQRSTSSTASSVPSSSGCSGAAAETSAALSSSIPPKLATIIRSR